MQNFKEFLEQLLDEEVLDEKAIVLGKKAYPKEGNILILAGGAGSGKGFASNRVIAFDGKRFDVDDLKNKLIKGASKTVAAKFKDETGREITSISQSNPEDTKLLYQFVSKHKYNDKVIWNFINQQKNTEHKQNIIFDVTLKELKKLQEISEYAENGGYDKKNIHLVWILNSIDVALAQNASRTRVVPKDVLIKTHEGVAMTLNDLLTNSENTRKYIDGDIYILFNNRNNNDIALKKIKDKETGKEITTDVVEKYVAIHLKERGKPIKKSNEISKELIDKVLSYIPDGAKDTWNFKH